ncbi:MAG TPA: nucleotidyltransferase family protein [Alphaproteobacteria bacterium]|nr:nucleotidyltransferase family protein [Alphaproteobacteria bacterium]
MIVRTVAPEEREHVLRALIAADPWRMQVLRTVRALDLPDWAIGAGFVRSRVWDWLGGDTRTTIPTDIDVLYHDPTDLIPERETVLERRLSDALPAPWSVTNQARMHIDNGDAPYASTIDALRHWLETPTAVAVRLCADDRIDVLAPWGLADLFMMTVRPTPSGRAKLDVYRRRIAQKNWASTWPTVRIAE